jgi:hypothetical protein
MRASGMLCGRAAVTASIQGAQFRGIVPIRAMLGIPGPSVIVIDGGGVLWHCGLPTGGWVQDIQQPPFAFKEFMGADVDANINAYVEALDTGGNAWVIGKNTQDGGSWGDWVQCPNLRPPGT